MSQIAAPSKSRRLFLLGASGALVCAMFGCTNGASALIPAPAGELTIADFDRSGKFIGKRKVGRIVKSDAEWKSQLTPESYSVTRHASTELAFSGALLNVHAPGVFHCICCETPLFNASAKFESGTGWPSFYQAIASENITVRNDSLFGMVRTEVICARCSAHLGRVFDDGPRPTGLRYCMNSVALDFVSAS
jgi:peptide-methionine (R)-S-oxide reductase